MHCRWVEGARAIKNLNTGCCTNACIHCTFNTQHPQFTYDCSQAQCDYAAGRKKVLGLSATLAGLSGLASAAAPTYWWYMGLRVCSGITAISMTLAARALATEPIGPSWRSQAEVLTWLFSILGGLVMVLISFLVSNCQLGFTLLSSLL